MGRKKVPTPTQEALKDELQEWYDNLPENFQNGSKGESLQEAIDALESANKPDIPEGIGDAAIEYTLGTKSRKSRSDRRNDCVTMLQAASECIQTEVTRLEELDYDEDSGDELADDDPQTEEERDTKVDELQTFVDEIDDATTEFENVEFPGMY